MLRSPSKAVAGAIEQAKLAYQFSPGSYTFSVLNAVLAVAESLQQPDWIEAFLDYWPARSPTDRSAA